MNKFLLLLLVVVYVDCNGLIRSSIARTSDYGQSYGSDYGSSNAYPNLYQQQVYQAAPQYKQEQPQIVEVQNEDVPIRVLFRARSPKIQVEQINEPGEKPTIQRTRSEEEPHRVMHEVLRPVIQEIREVIQPYRRVVQEIQPVIEQVQTVVARGDGRANGGAQSQGLLLSQPLQLNNQGLGGSGYGRSEYGNDNEGYGNSGYSNAGYGNTDYGKLATLGLQASRSQLWNNAKSLSRSKAASS